MRPPGRPPEDAPQLPITEITKLCEHCGGHLRPPVGGKLEAVEKAPVLLPRLLPRSEEGVVKRDPDKYREWQRASQRRYEDRLRAEGHHKFRRIGPNRERKAKEWKRAYGSEERVKAINAMPSVVSGKTPCVNAHVRDLNRPASGMGRKGDADLIVPLTWGEHQELHQFGQDSFEDRHGIDLAAEARRIDEELSA